MELVEIKPKIYFAKFENQYQMCMAVMRIEDQEEYRFKDRVFTHDELMDWYAEKYGNGQFTYFDDYAGFCVHSGMLRRFMRIFKPHDMIAREMDFIASIKDVVPPSVFNHNKYFSIICTYNGENSIVYNHELAHAIAYTSRSYYRKIKEILKSMPTETKNKLFGRLIEMGYTEKDQHMDEINARLVSEYDVCKSLDIKVKINKPIINKLIKLFKEYKNGGKSE